MDLMTIFKMNSKTQEKMRFLVIKEVYHWVNNIHFLSIAFKAKIKEKSSLNFGNNSNNFSLLDPEDSQIINYDPFGTDANEYGFSQRNPNSLNDSNKKKNSRHNLRTSSQNSLNKKVTNPFLNLSNSQNSKNSLKNLRDSFANVNETFGAYEL